MSLPVPPPEFVMHPVATIDEATAAFHQLADAAAASPEFAAQLTSKRVGNPITVKIVPTSAEWTEKMIRKASQAGADWEKGIQNPSADPKAAALAAKGKYLQRTQDSLKNDSWAKGVAKYDLDMAIRTALKVGGSGYVNGITARQDKIQAKIDKLQPLVAANKTAVQALPQASDADRENRMIANLRNMRAIGDKMRS